MQSETSFTYSGTLTGADTLSLIASGTPNLQSNGAYAVNAAGVVVVAGNGAAVGQTSPNPDNGTAYGSLLLIISGSGFTATEQIFPADIANGLGSASPSTSLFCPITSLSDLGFGPFSVTDPTLTFVISDTIRSDNSGIFTVTAVPETSTWAMMVLGFLGAGFLLIATRRSASAAGARRGRLRGALCKALSSLRLTEHRRLPGPRPPQPESDEEGA